MKSWKENMVIDLLPTAVGLWDNIGQKSNSLIRLRHNTNAKQEGTSTFLVTEDDSLSESVSETGKEKTERIPCSLYTFLVYHKFDLVNFLQSQQVPHRPPCQLAFAGKYKRLQITHSLNHSVKKISAI
ncbi:MAG: hypothetical protein D3925_02840 [Candidatus Electrothrix sp. AR5]|nr:hypothetical protein [Candidatus Electrothrix sp. AR5]